MFRFGSKFRYRQVDEHGLMLSILFTHPFDFSGRTQKQTEREGKTKQRNKEFTRLVVFFSSLVRFLNGI